jgi:hypothetical protein
MLHLLSLLLPCLFPSWRFFQEVEASPRVEWRISTNDASAWAELRPRPAHLSVWHMFGRLFWNPDCARTLYMVSLAERMAIQPSAHSLHALRAQVCDDLRKTHRLTSHTQLQFRIVWVSRINGAVQRVPDDVSDPFALQPK